ncbi:hypothetical protein PR001_g9854 [Phytophthora rubi]|uniref:Uncharacterized protein n=1 Tax=Phytophthora rubi TaxID=129364 RepID=A0A6A3MRB7_9STRA|nr:hypothetical protein PR001_g9854 [Phytophthora rubi]KAE9041594.1 hypothetical protein PR002_g4365 [Phytophthora rubi]
MELGSRASKRAPTYRELRRDHSCDGDYEDKDPPPRKTTHEDDASSAIGRSQVDERRMGKWPR